MSYLLQAKCFIRSIPWKMFYSWFLEKCDTYANNPPPCSHACYHNAANIVSNPIPKNRCKNHFCSASGNWEMAEWDRPFICSIGWVHWYLARPPSPITSPINPYPWILKKNPKRGTITERVLRKKRSKATKHIQMTQRCDLNFIRTCSVPRFGLFFLGFTDKG